MNAAVAQPVTDVDLVEEPGDWYVGRRLVRKPVAHGAVLGR